MSFGLGINGALGGAAQGASIGSAIPGVGTTLGGIIGGRRVCTLYFLMNGEFFYFNLLMNHKYYFVNSVIFLFFA